MVKDFLGRPRFEQTTIYDSMTKLQICKEIFRGIDLESISSMLDIGCGDAPELTYIARNYKPHGFVIGIDTDPHTKWKKAISQNSKSNFIVASAHYLPLRPHMFDYVFMKDLLHHISKNRIEVIKEAYTVVGNKGILRVIEANRYSINPILVFKNDKSHEHFTFEQMNSMKKRLSFDELYGFELLPTFSSSKKDIIWNFFVLFFWFSSIWSIGRLFQSLYLKMKKILLPGKLTYYVLGKRKRDEADS